MRPAPAGATRFLKLFCPTSEYEAVTGDLLEQYQRGHGRFWYWRQVFSIAFLGLYRKVVDRPLVRTKTSMLGRGFAVCIGAAVLVAVALTDIWPILIVGVAGGVIAGILKFGYDNQHGMDLYPGIRLPVGNPTEPVAIATKSEPAFAFHEIRRGPERESPIHVHRGINSASIAGEGLDGLPGLLMTIAFVFIFLGLFWPRNNDWLGALFFIAEIGGSAIYIVVSRRNRRDSERCNQALHQINEEPMVKHDERRQA